MQPTLKVARFLALLLILALSACQGASGPVLPSPDFRPTPRPTPVPATPAPLRPDMAVYLPALRPRFAADLEAMAAAPRYELDLQLDVERQQLAGHEVLHYTNRQVIPLAELYLRLYPNYPGCSSWAEVGAVQVRERLVVPTYEVSRTAILVPLSPPLQPGAAITLGLDFVVRLPSEAPCRYKDFGYDGAIFTLAHTYPQAAVYDGDGWDLSLGATYGDLVYAETALYSVTLRLPAGWTVAATGTEVGRRGLAGGGEAISWVAGPARDFYLVLGQEYLALAQAYEDVQVTSYYLPGHEAAGRRALEAAISALRIFEDTLGPYRYGELEVVETTTLAGGIEYPGVVAISTDYYSPAGGDLETVVVHEVAHQWWYSLVGNDQVDEPWVDEALVTYVVALYYEESGVKEYAKGYMEWNRRRYQSMVDRGLDQPANMPVPFYSEEQYGPLVYSKGALFFQALREQAGDDVFRLILQTYYQRYLYGLATGNDLLAVVEEVWGQDVHTLYQEMMLSPAEAP